MLIFCARSRRLDGFPRTCVMRTLSMLAMSARCAISCGGPCWLNSTTSLPRGSAAGPWSSSRSRLLETQRPL